MLPFIPDDAHRILDVGCGAGGFAAALRAARPGTAFEIWGVEMEPAAAALAETVCNRVLIGDAVAVLEHLPADQFDCLVMNDVLEHLANPSALLRAATRVLIPVISLPNVRYFFNVLNLTVHGRWDYTDEGILDRTHLRFFTRSSLLKLLADEGFTVRRVQGINPTGSLKFWMTNVMTFGRWSDMRWLQFACVAQSGKKA